MIKSFISPVAYWNNELFQQALFATDSVSWCF